MIISRETFRFVMTIAITALLLVSPVLSVSQSTVMQFRVDPLVIELDEIRWGQPGGGNGVPIGVQTSRQGTDPETGGITYYAKFPAGSHFDLHWHTHDEFVVVVSGELTIVLGDEGHDLSVGSYIVIPGKLNHSWDVPVAGEDAIILVRRAGPADFNFVDK